MKIVSAVMFYLFHSHFFSNNKIKTSNLLLVLYESALFGSVLGFFCKGKYDFKKEFEGRVILFRF